MTDDTDALAEARARRLRAEIAEALADVKRAAREADRQRRVGEVEVEAGRPLSGAVAEAAADMTRAARDVEAAAGRVRRLQTELAALAVAGG